MKAWKWLLAVGFVLLAAAVFVRTYSQARKDPDTDDEEEETIHVPSRVSEVNGQTVLTLDAGTQKRLGIAVSPLSAIHTRRQESAAATVLSAQGLVPLHNAYVSAETQIETAQAQLAVSSQEYERLKTLYAENQNTSKKALEAAEGMVRTNRANLDAARKELGIASFAVQQSWGGAVAGWVVNNSPPLASVLGQQAVLVQLSLPPGSAWEDSPIINLSTPTGNSVEASYVSPFPQVDPRIQGLSMLYLARAYPALEPGMNLVAHLPVGRRLKGVLVPRSAIIWWRGQVWVYEQTSPNRFARRDVPTDQPLGDGYFVASGFAPGAKVVTQGAQALLSEEFRSQIQPSGD